MLLAATTSGCATAVPDAVDKDAGADPADAAASSLDAPTAIDAGVDPPLDAAPPACAQPFTGVLASWDFASEPGSQASTAVASFATGVTATAVTRSPGLTAVSGAGSINASSWPTSAQRDLAKYYALTLSPPTGCALALTSLAIDARASGTGPTSAVVATGADGFAQTAAVSTAAATSAPVAVTGATASVEVRIYGFAASGAAGTMRLQSTLTVTGSLQ